MLVLGIGTVRPVYAHDSFAAASDDPKDRDKRSEASQLTEELRTVSAKSTRSPTIQAAVSGKAERRRALINSLAKTSPSAVIQLALSPAERAALPPSIQGYVEQRVDLTGEFQLLHVDHADGHSSYDARLLTNGVERRVQIGAPLRQVKPGDLVKGQGIALSGDPTIVTDQLVVTQSPTTVGTTGNQRTAIILVMGDGTSTHPYANKTATASIFFSSTNSRSARSFYQEASYGQTIIVGGSGNEGTASDVFGPYKIDTSGCDSSTIRSQAMAAADSAIDYNTYDRLVISIANDACGDGGIGTIRPQSMGYYDGVWQRLSVSWNFGNALGSTWMYGKIGGVALHEYGHNLGVWHANALECGGSSITGTSCSSDEYGDPSDVMGISSGYGHLNGAHKDILGWVTGRVQTASDAGTYVINAYEDGAANTKVLKVPRTRDSSGNVNGYYYLEYRKPSGTWDNFLDGQSEYGEGVLVHTSGATPFCTFVCDPDFTGPGGGGDSNLIDTHPGSVGGSNDFKDAPLTNGQSYVDTGAGVSIQVTETGSGSATVSVSFSTPRPTVYTIVYPEGAGTVNGGGTFNAGQSVTLTASPGNCFVGWRENRASQAYPNPYTFTVTADRTLEAVFTDEACASPPSNDTFPGPTVGAGQQNVITSGATTQAGEPTSFSCGGTSLTIGRTAWYTITPVAMSQITLNTSGSDFDTVLAVYTGDSVNGLSAVACNDDVSGGGLSSQVQFTGQAGVSYRVQLGGYDSDSGTGVLNVAIAALQPDLRQAGPIQVGGNLSVGGTATFAVPVKNYGGAPGPATHPYIDGTTSTGQTWHADGSEPASAVIQPGQTVTFTVRVTLTSVGSWTANSVSLWNNDSNTFWQALPANGQNQQFSFLVGMSCSPRPKITVQTALSGDGRLSVTITAGIPEQGNRLTGLQFGPDAKTPMTNALLDLPGIASGRSAQQAASVSIPNNPVSYTFYVRRQTPGVPVTVPLTITDGCGPWQTLVGGGTAAGF
jgi:M6 family metalloprotease-like protein